MSNAFEMPHISPCVPEFMYSQILLKAAESENKFNEISKENQKLTTRLLDSAQEISNIHAQLTDHLKRISALETQLRAAVENLKK
jgi:septal ring factor EnvC (AmiA/AmiB activator)